MITCDAFVTDTRGFRVQTNIVSKQDDFSTFSTKALDIYKLPHSLIHMSTTKRMSCCKTSNIFYSTVPRIVKIFWETYRLYSPSLAFKLFDPHAGPSRLMWVKPNAQIFTQMRFFPLNLVCWNKDRRLNQFGRPKFEFDSAHVKYGF